MFCDTCYELFDLMGAAPKCFECPFYLHEVCSHENRLYPYDECHDCVKDISCDDCEFVL